MLARKKDGLIRLCVDYRQLNRKVIRDRYPLPLLEDQLDLLQDAKKIDFSSEIFHSKNGFFHGLMDKQSRKLTSFIVSDGYYKFLRVSFGLYNSPTIFQGFINVVFRNLIQDKC